MYQRPWRSSSSSSEAASTSSTGTQASSAAAAGGGGERRSSSRLGGHASWQSSQPYKRSPSASRNSSGKSPGAWRRWARQRRASSTPGATRAPVGQAGKQRVHVPHPSATGIATGSVASVTTDPSTNHEPCSGSSTFVFFPYQPSPARTA